MINVAVVTGRLTDAPELKSTPTGVSVCSFSVAVQRNFKNSDGEYDADFIDIVAWRQTAEYLCKYANKGDLVCIKGRIQTRKYQDKNGNNRISFEIVSDEASVLSFRKKDDNEIKPDAIGGNDVEFEEVEDGDLPF